MSDYLTSLIERSLGLPPLIEPLIAPMHAPSRLVLSPTGETGNAFESSSAAKIDTSRQNAPPRLAGNVRTVEPAYSQTGSQPTRPSSPPSVAPAELAIEEKDDWPHPIQLRPKIWLRETASTSSPLATPIVSHGAVQIVVQPETISPLKPATSPLVPALESSPKGPPSLPRATRTGVKRTTRVLVQPEFTSPLKPAASPPVRMRRLPPTEPSAVNVTIGRVEVRAVMPRAVAPKPALRSGPKLSLEEYLKQRNGRRS